MAGGLLGGLVGGAVKGFMSGGNKPPQTGRPTATGKPPRPAESPVSRRSGSGGAIIPVSRERSKPVIVNASINMDTSMLLVQAIKVLSNIDRNIAASMNLSAAVIKYQEQAVRQKSESDFESSSQGQASPLAFIGNVFDRLFSEISFQGQNFVMQLGKGLMLFAGLKVFSDFPGFVETVKTGLIAAKDETIETFVRIKHLAEDMGFVLRKFVNFVSDKLVDLGVIDYMKTPEQKAEYERIKKERNDAKFDAADPDSTAKKRGDAQRRYNELTSKMNSMRYGGVDPKSRDAALDAEQNATMERRREETGPYSQKSAGSATTAGQAWLDFWNGTPQKVPSGSMLNAEEQEAYDFFISKGYSPAAAYGLVANLRQESQLDPNAKGDKGTSFGIAQWHDPNRQKNFEKFAGKSIQDSTDRREQLEFIAWELENTHKKARDALRKEGLSAADAARAVDELYEQSNQQSKETRAAVAAAMAGEPYVPGIGVIPKSRNTDLSAVDQFAKLTDTMVAAMTSAAGGPSASASSGAQTKRASSADAPSRGSVPNPSPPNSSMDWMVYFNAGNMAYA